MRLLARSILSTFKRRLGIWRTKKAGPQPALPWSSLVRARKLADQLQVQLSAVLWERNVEQAANLLIAHGADNVYLIDDPIPQKLQ